MYEKLSSSNKANNRPVSVLPLLSKVFEKKCLENFLSELLCGFRKLHRAYALFRLLQKYQTELDSGTCVGTIFMNLYKAYDCIT